ncbi:MAG: amino acid ABC transporter permease, partial [Gammaproteobacteria bacterium]|nr:amino acid ABC transporter permease [Gammaproteobacteria bacterium]
MALPSTLPFVTAALVLGTLSLPTPADVVVGSKSFTESVILGELATLAARTDGVPVRHQAQLGGTRILWNALKSGEIDVYPEYTGTLSQEILGVDSAADVAALKPLVREHGLSMTAPLGFNNTYALGMRRDVTARLRVRSISDLLRHNGLDYGFSNEFMDRADGWPGLKRHYRMRDATATGMDHDLAYRALAAGDLDVIDLYTTDAEIEYYDITVLEDDRDYFPEYRAVYLMRTDTMARYPALVDALDRLAGRIDNTAMVAMNGQAKLQKRPESEVAADFLASLGVDADPSVPSRWRAVLTRTREHLLLVSISLGAAILISIPLGI